MHCNAEMSILNDEEVQHVSSSRSLRSSLITMLHLCGEWDICILIGSMFRMVRQHPVQYAANYGQNFMSCTEYEHMTSCLLYPQAYTGARTGIPLYFHDITDHDNAHMVNNIHSLFYTVMRSGSSSVVCHTRDCLSSRPTKISNVICRHCNHFSDRTKNMGLVMIRSIKKIPADIHTVLEIWSHVFKRLTAFDEMEQIRQMLRSIMW